MVEGARVPHRATPCSDMCHGDRVTLLTHLPWGWGDTARATQPQVPPAGAHPVPQPQGGPRCHLPQCHQFGLHRPQGESLAPKGARPHCWGHRGHVATTRWGGMILGWAHLGVQTWPPRMWYLGWGGHTAPRPCTGGTGLYWAILGYTGLPFEGPRPQSWKMLEGRVGGMWGWGVPLTPAGTFIPVPGGPGGPIHSWR